MSSPITIDIEVTSPAAVALEVATPTVDVTPDPDGAQVLVVAVPGPPGPAGAAGDGGFEFVQTTPAATWTIPNTLGRYPAAVTVIVGGEVVDPDIDIPDTTVIVATFAAPTSGRAEII